jgi:hypothetical protein
VCRRRLNYDRDGATRPSATAAAGSRSPRWCTRRWVGGRAATGALCTTRAAGGGGVRETPVVDHPHAALFTTVVESAESVGDAGAAA